MIRLGFKLMVVSIVGITMLAFNGAWCDTVSGIVYHDNDISSRSHYFQAYDDADSPIPDMTVVLHGADTSKTTLTDAQGEFIFEGLEPGYYLLEIKDPTNHRCTSTNLARRVAEAIKIDGHLEILSIGDSISVEGAEYPFPQRLRDHLANITEVTLFNQAIGGSKSFDWLPGAQKAYFENRLLPYIEQADLVTITLGGNDLDFLVEGLEPPFTPEMILEMIITLLENPEIITGIMENVRTLVYEIHKLNQSCDVIYVIYPCFARSDHIRKYTGEALQPLAIAAMELGLRMLRNYQHETECLLLGDAFAYNGTDDITELLVDEVHPSAAGAQQYADLIFETIGGVIVGEERLGQSRMVGLYAPDAVHSPTPTSTPTSTPMPSRTPTPSATPTPTQTPMILLAGWWDSYVTSKHGGRLSLYALADLPLGFRIELYYQGLSTGVYLEYSSGELYVKDFGVLPGGLPPGEWLIELAVDGISRWPVLKVYLD